MVQRRLVDRPFQTDLAIGQGADLFKVFALVLELWIWVITCNIELGKGHTVVSECTRNKAPSQLSKMRSVLEGG